MNPKPLKRLRMKGMQAVRIKSMNTKLLALAEDMPNLESLYNRPDTGLLHDEHSQAAFAMCASAPRKSLESFRQGPCLSKSPEEQKQL